MRVNIDVLLEYHFAGPTDVLLAVEVAQLPDQRLIEDRLTVDGSGPLRPVAGQEGIGRRTWLTANGPLRAAYRAIVDVDRRAEPIDAMAVTPLHDLPADVVPYLWPSRYCEADRFEAFVDRAFGGLDGGARLTAMAAWINEWIDYRPGSSDTSTTAADTFVSRQGVCRDFAHLLTAFARAASVPARLVSGYAPKLEPPDFHALVEAWLDGGWRLVDPTGLSQPENVVRICVGRDATDIAFMTSFGPAEMISQSVTVSREDGVDLG